MFVKAIGRQITQILILINFPLPESEVPHIRMSWAHEWRK